MKKWWSRSALIVLLLVCVSSASAEAGVDPFIGFGLGVADFSFYNCQSDPLEGTGATDCGVDPSLLSTGFLFKGGFFYNHWRESLGVDFGWELEWYQAIGFHIHDEGEIDNRVATLRLLVRKPLLVSSAHPNGKIQPYAGIGIGSDFLRVVPKDKTVYGNQFDCNHPSQDLSLGIKYFVSGHTALFVEQRVYYSRHKDMNDTRPDISFDQRTISIVLGVAYHI